MYLMGFFHSLENCVHPRNNRKRCTVKYGLLLSLVSAFGRKPWFHRHGIVNFLQFKGRTLYKKISNLKNAKEVESVKGVKLSAQGPLFQ